MSSPEMSYPFRFERRYEVVARAFGVTPQRTAILVAGGRLRARFGPWSIDTPLTNLTTVSLTGPYAFLKTAGPAHLGFTDHGLTFATNSQAGVCVEFVEPISGIDPFGRIRHPNLTLTPADCAGLASALGGLRSAA